MLRPASQETCQGATPNAPSVGGRSEVEMSNVTVSSQVSAALAPARIAPILSALLLGVVVIAGAGFASVPALHNAAHDQRHSIGFPCH